MWAGESYEQVAPAKCEFCGGCEFIRHAELAGGMGPAAEA